MMIERIRPWVRGKKVLILGFGREENLPGMY